MSSSNTKTRQKSCIPCAASKRRCDRRTPICTKCASKSILCQYKVTPQRSSIPVAEAPLPPPAGSHDSEMESNNLHQTSPRFSYQETSLPVSMTDFSQQTNSFLDVDETFLDIYDMQLLNNPLPHPQIGTMDRFRVAYIIKILRSYPYLLLTTTKTPFINPSLFSPTIPSPLQDAISACSLYFAKNEINETAVWEVISSMAAKLNQSRPSWTVAEHLSYVQALIIFQIIRLFDGDIRARGDGEEAEPVLDEWTDRLALRTGIIAEGLENAPLEPGRLIERGWENWVFEESVKRTVIVSRMVTAMYSVLKRGYCTYVEKVTELSFTAKKGVWEASSAVHWRLAVEAEERFYVQRMELDGILRKARLEEVDELGLLMLVTYKGVDEVNDWIVRMGSSALIE